MKAACSALSSCFAQSVPKPNVRLKENTCITKQPNVALQIWTSRFLFYLTAQHFFLWLSLCPSTPPSVTGAGLFCWGLAEAADGKSAGEAANTSCLPEFERVNLQRGHNGFSLAKAPHMQPACHQPCSCSLTPFRVSLSSVELYIRLQKHVRHARCRTSTACLDKTKRSFSLCWKMMQSWSYKRQQECRNFPHQSLFASFREGSCTVA